LRAAADIDYTDTTKHVSSEILQTEHRNRKSGSKRANWRLDAVRAEVVYDVGAAIPLCTLSVFRSAMNTMNAQVLDHRKVASRSSLISTKGSGVNAIRLQIVNDV
jgi:hypothetical protein